jgi:hypothetical protein
VLGWLLNEQNPPHVIHYHSLLRATFFPELSVSILANIFAPSMGADGFLPEYPGGDGTDAADPDTATAALGVSSRSQMTRDMSGGASVFIIDVEQTYRSTNNTAFLSAMWPFAAKAIGWQLARAQQFGIPNHLQSTYDSWELDTQDITSYSGHLHIAALRAGRKLAMRKGSVSLAAQCTSGIANATAAMQTKLWRATTDSNGSSG